jgi:hypothetical protein
MLSLVLTYFRIIVDTISSDFVTILQRGAQPSNRPAIAELKAALQSAELTARKEKIAIPFDSLIGEWRLCFATGASKDKSKGVKIGRGYYLPKFIAASIAFTKDLTVPITGTATNKLSIGNIQIQFTGPCRYPGKKNLLVFDFTEIQFKIFNKIVYQGKIRSGKNGEPNIELISIARLPFFAFFWADTNEIAARGRTGGMALWVRD